MCSPRLRRLLVVVPSSSQVHGPGELFVLDDGSFIGRLHKHMSAPHCLSPRIPDILTSRMKPRPWSEAEKRMGPCLVAQLAWISRS